MPKSSGSRSSKKLLSDALKLTRKGRAALANELYASLGFDEEVIRAWEREAARRSREVESGAVKAIPWSEAKKLLFPRKLKKA